MWTYQTISLLTISHPRSTVSVAERATRRERLDMKPNKSAVGLYHRQGGVACSFTKSDKLSYYCTVKQPFAENRKHSLVWSDDCIVLMFAVCTEFQ